MPADPDSSNDMNPILLINPNTSQATTQMMVEIARSSLGGRAAIRGLTMESGVPMIVEESDLQAAADVVGAVDVGSVGGV
ncbi:hydantoin racemase, partial [Cupriavidus pinatubonensis]